jgi:hypothetical protein
VYTVVQPISHQHNPTSKLRTHTSIRDALNLDRHTLRQLLDRDTAPRRLMRKVLLVNAVHLSEVRHVVEEDVDLDDSLDSDTRLPQYPHDILAAHLRLIRNGALDQIALCVGGDLARDEDVGACDDGLGLEGCALVHSTPSFSIEGVHEEEEICGRREEEDVHKAQQLQHQLLAHISLKLPNIHPPLLPTPSQL